MNHRFVSLFASAVVLAACTGGATNTTVATTPAPTATATRSTDATATSTTTTSTAPPTTGVPDGIEDLPAEMQQEIIELAAVTEEIRGLRFLQPPTVVVVTPEELATRVQESIEEDIEDVPADEALFELLGLIDPEVDLLQMYSELYGEQVAGYYDGETGELVVPAGESFTQLQKATLIHELTHALTDQRFGFNDAYERLIDEDRFDEAVAFLSVIEGDATLTEILYIQQLPRTDQQELLADLFGSESPVFDSVPPFIQDSLVFPYEQGLAFVQRAFDIGGFDEINRLYVEPPVSSEQIFEPRDYQTDMPIDVSLVAPVVSGYEVVYESVWGQLGFTLMFDQVLGLASRQASEGWGGDAYVQWFNGSEAALLIVFEGDEPADLDEMFQALTGYSAVMAVGDAVEEGGGVLFEGDDFAFVRQTEDRVVFVAAGDPVTGRQIVASLP